MSYRYIIIEKNQLIIRLHEHGKSRIYIFFIIECIILKLNMKYQLTIINTDYFLLSKKKYSKSMQTFIKIFRYVLWVYIFFKYLFNY